MLRPSVIALALTAAFAAPVLAAPIPFYYNPVGEVVLAYHATINAATCYGDPHGSGPVVSAPCAGGIVGTTAAGAFTYNFSNQPARTSVNLIFAPMGITIERGGWHDGALSLNTGGVDRLSAELYSALGPSGGVHITSAGTFVLSTGQGYSSAMCPNGCRIDGTLTDAVAVNRTPEPGVLALIGLVIILMAVFIPIPAKYFSETEIGF